jgi:nitrite reductase (NADH) small subunit
MSESAASAAHTYASSAEWIPICAVGAIRPDTGACALVNGVQIAIFRVDDRVFALSNHDPFSGAPVLARGLVGDRSGVLKVASPIFKQSFALDTGVCLDDPTVCVPTYPCRIRAGIIEVAI